MKNTYVQQPAQVVIVAWDNMDLTDFTAPLEVFSHGRNENGERLLNTTVAAKTELVATSQGLQVARNVDIETLLSQISSYDILVIPGGGGFTAENIPAAPGVRETLKAWAALPARPEKPRALMSICAGAFFLAEAGFLVGKTATTHYSILKELRTVGEKNGGIKVVRQHYVDAGVSDNGTRIITSGGIVSGFDSSLFLLETYLSPQVAEGSRAIMDASWRKEMTPLGFA